MSMRQILFGDSDPISVAILMKSTAFNKSELLSNYVTPLKKLGIPYTDVGAFSLTYDAKKVTTKFAKEYLTEWMPVLKSMGVKYIYCTDSNYFKLLVKEQKADIHMGYVLPCEWPGCEDMKVVLGLNYQQLIYKPELKEKVDQSLSALAAEVNGTYQAPGTGIIHKAIYPTGAVEIRKTLEALLEYPELTIDIEAFSLRFWEAGIGTISLAIDEHRGVAFACDYEPNKIQPPLVEKRAEYGRFVPNQAVRAHLKWFFETYKGRITFHHAGYDVKVIIYVLWMKSLLDTEGLLTGLEVMTRALDDTKIIAYLATNSTAGNVLGLKPLAQEFAGNWAMDDIKDIKQIPLESLLQYNLVDALSTWYVKKKYYPIMVQDQQEELYKGLMLASLKLILQIELTGMPMNKSKVVEVKTKLEAMQAKYISVIRSCSLIPVFEDMVTEKQWEDDYQTRKNKAKNPDKILYKDRATFPKHVFNPNSGPQLQVLLYSMMGLPVIDRTDTKQPATGADTLEKLINHVTDPEHGELLSALIGHGEVTKILSTFIPAFEQAIAKDDSGIVWLHGSFNIGGTVSGRLSSSDPKQNWALQA